MGLGLVAALHRRVAAAHDPVPLPHPQHEGAAVDVARGLAHRLIHLVRGRGRGRGRSRVGLGLGLEFKGRPRVRAIDR